MRGNTLTRPCLYRWLMAATIDWGVIVGALALSLYANSLAGHLLAVLVIGNRQHALSILGHDGGHRSVCRTRWLNDALTNLLCFWPLGVGIHSYRKFHFAHHRLTGTPLDPELEFKRRAAPCYDLPATNRVLGRQFVKDLLGGGIREVIGLVKQIRPITLGDRFGPLLWWTIAGSACLYGGCWQAPLLWFGAIVTTYWATFRLRIWIEHMGTNCTHRVWLCWWQRLLFAPHNTWYHYEHHRWPAIPFARLPAARNLDHTVPVVPMQDLLVFFETSDPVPSGQAASMTADSPDSVPEEALLWQ